MTSPQSIQLPEKTNLDLVNLHPHVKFQWLYDGKAFYINISSSSRDAIDAYVKTNLLVLQAWDPTKHFYSFQDVSHDKVTITPYFRQGLDNVSAEVQKLGIQGDSMILMANNIMGKVIQVYGKIFAQKTQPITQHWFTKVTFG